MRVGVVSGHSLEKLMDSQGKLSVETDYGDVEITIGEIGNREVVFINRHGPESNLPPHRINYHANISALKKLNVDSIISIGTVGSLNPDIKPGYIVIPHEFIDFTKNRKYTFFDNSRTHIDMSEPFCPYLRNIIIETCRENKIKFSDRGVYLVTEGPRLETKSEIKLFKGHADVVGMTLVPEVILAREREICYASINLVCNMAAGMQGKLSAEDIKIFFNEKKETLLKLVKDVIAKIEDTRNCNCRNSLKEATL